MLKEAHIDREKYSRIKHKYSKYVASLNTSERDGDDEGLCNKPPFSEEVYEMERNGARNNPPAAISTVMEPTESLVQGTPTCTRKRNRSESFS